MIWRQLKGGSRTLGLIKYLYGPGRANEHTDPHMVGAWREHVSDPGRRAVPLESLAAQLDMPLHALTSKPPKKHVWHATASSPEGDRSLSDAEWGEIARELVDAAGIAPAGDDYGCRWVAIKHDDRHIHIVATLARQDGTRPDSGDRMKNNFRTIQSRRIQVEERLGLKFTAPADKTASKRPTRGEMEKAKRNDRPEPPRITLQGKVRQAAASARSEEEFFRAVEGAGIRLRKRTAPDGRITGYAVALPGDRTASGRAVWYRGSTLAPDLSLPRVRERWAGAAGRSAGATVASRAEAWQLAAEHVHQAAAVLGQAGHEAGAGEMAALADFLTTYAADAPVVVRRELRAAAVAFERAGRAPTSRRLDSQASRHLREATRLVMVGAALAGSADTAAAIALMVAVALAVVAAMRWHQAQRYAAQEGAAAQAGAHLRAATEVAYGATSSGRRGTGGMWHRTSMQPDGPALTETYEQTVRTAVPQLTDQVLNEAAWPALAATLRTAENAGYDPSRVLADVAAIRDFGDAQSAAEVLVWRLQRRMDNDIRNGVDPQPAAAQQAPSSEAPPLTSTRTTPVDATPLGAGADAPTLGVTVRRAVPIFASDVLSDPAAVALAAALNRAAENGYDPGELLAEVSAARDLGDADSVAQVLTWRVQGRVRYDRQTTPPTRITGRKSPTAPHVPSERTAAERAAQEAADRRNQRRGPRR